MPSADRAGEPACGSADSGDDDFGPLLDTDGGPDYRGDPEFPEPVFNDPDFGIDPWGFFESMMIAGDVRESEWDSWKQRWKESRDPERFAADVARAHPEAAEDIAQHVWDIWAIQLPEDRD